MMIASPIGASLVGKVPARTIITISTAIAGAGLFLFIKLDPRSTAMDVIIPLVVMAFGTGFGMSQRTSIVASAVPISEIGIASSILALVRNIAGAFGITLFSTILTNSTENHLITITQNSITNTNNPLIMAQVMGLMGLKAQIDGFRTVYTVAAFILFASAVIAYFTLNIKELRNGVEIIAE
jgi:hypothetical protein